LEVQEVEWDKEGSVRAEDYNFFLWKMKEYHQLGTEFIVHRRILSAVKSVSERVLYTFLTGRWFNIIVLNVPAPSDENGDDAEESFKRI
jgi:hypothetical protein